MMNNKNSVFCLHVRKAQKDGVIKGVLLHQGEF